MYYSIKVLLVSVCVLAGAVFAAGGAVPVKSQKPKSQIIVRPGPPVKPTKAAKPNSSQKSDWGTSAGAQR